MARWLGIELAADALRGAVVRTTLRRTEIERYVEIPLAGPSDGPGRALELTEAARNLLTAVGGAPSGIVASIGGEDASLRVVELPAAARKRIAEVLPFELETLLPYDPHDAIIDHQPVSEDASGLRLLVAAVAKAKVGAEIERWRKLGLEPSELGAGAAVLDGLTSIVPALQGQDALLVDLGDHRIDVCALVAGRCAGARTIGVGMLDMPGAGDDARVELQRTLAGLRASGVPAQGAAYYCGSGANGHGVREWLSEVLGQDVSPLTLTDAVAGNSMGNSAGAPSFAKALALASRAASGRRRIDLRQGEFVPTAARGQLASQLNLAITCAVIVVMTAMFSLKAHQSLLASEEQALTDELASVTKDVLGEAIDDPQLAEARIKNPKSSDPLPRFDAYDAVAALSSAIPADMTHEMRRLRVDIADEKAEGRFELQGTLESIGQRDELVAALAKHPCFKDLEPGRTNATAGTEQRLAYQLEAKLQCPGEVGADGKKKGKTTEAMQ